MEPESSSPYSQVYAICPYPEPTPSSLHPLKLPENPSLFVSRGSISPCEYFLTKVFHGEALLAPRPTPMLEDQPSSAVRDCLFNIFAAILHIGGRSSNCNLRTRHAVVTGTHLSRPQIVHYVSKHVFFFSYSKITALF